MKIIYSLHKLK